MEVVKKYGNGGRGVKMWWGCEIDVVEIIKEMYMKEEL
jgi:hypothetical protein